MIKVDCDGSHEVHMMLEQRVEQWNAEILERGREEGRRETALALIRKTDFDDATIADISKLPLEEIQALRNLPSAH